MAYPEVLIPPSVKPVSPVEVVHADDQTTPFSPRFGRGATQRQAWGDPLFGFKPRYEAMRSSDRAHIRRVIAESRGKAANIRFTLGLPLRGSFPATEQLLNNDFNGTTSWSAGSQWSISAADRVLRSTRSVVSVQGDAALATLSSGLSQYAPYCGRFFIAGNGGYLSTSTFRIDDRNNSMSGATQTGFGMLSQVHVTGSGGNIQLALVDLQGSGLLAGNYLDITYASLSRCALVDNGPNALTYSDQLDNAAYTKVNATISANAGGGPDGTAGISDQLVENATNGAHSLSQGFAVTSAAQDITVSVDIFPATRSWCILQLTDLSAHGVGVYFNATTGAFGSTYTLGTNVTNLRYFARALGGGWYRIFVIARKTSTQTTMYWLFGSASADNTQSYAGVAAAATHYLWRATAAISSFPTRGAQTTTTGTTGTSQTGSSLYLKGLPASTSGLLLAGDFVEINGEQVQCAATLDSDAGGTGVLKVRPALVYSAADNEPVIILNPYGRFMNATDPRMTERFGTYTDAEFDLIAAY